MRFKKVVSIILIAILILTNAISIGAKSPRVYAEGEIEKEAPFKSGEEAVEAANRDLVTIYGIPEGSEFYKEKKFTNSIEVDGKTKKVNDMLAKGEWEDGKFGSILVYGKPYEKDSKTGRHRYLGYTLGEDPFTNILHPDDRKVDWKFEDIADPGEYRKTGECWIFKPWELSDYKLNMNVSDDFDTPEYQMQLEQLVEEGILQFYQERVDDEAKFRDIDWMDYAHIMQPATYHNYGMARLWHRDSDGKMWYLTVPIMPFKVLTNKYFIVSSGFLDDGTTATVDFLDSSGYSLGILGRMQEVYTKFYAEVYSADVNNRADFKEEVTKVYKSYSPEKQQQIKEAEQFMNRIIKTEKAVNAWKEYTNLMIGLENNYRAIEKRYGKRGLNTLKNQRENNLIISILEGIYEEGENTSVLGNHALEDPSILYKGTVD